MRALEWHHHEEDIFIHQAIQNANASGAHLLRGTQCFVTDVYSEMYEPLHAADKLEIRRWWHEMVRGKANQFTDLRARLAQASLSAANPRRRVYLFDLTTLVFAALLQC